MPKDKLTDYDSTAANNLDVGGISVAEGMLPSGVNNAIRELMSHQADAFGAGTPLYVDQTNNRVGVGTASPSASLDVDGTIKLDGNYPVGTGNVALGDTALDSNVSGNYNTAIGGDALTANTASNNTAVGYQAAYSNTTGSPITAIGRKSLYSNTTGIDNTALGRNALFYNTTGSSNTALGHQALDANTTANNNTAVGYRSLLSNTTASNNTAVGYQAGYSNTTGVQSTMIGERAGENTTTGNYNCYVGGQSGQSATTGTQNNFFGWASGYQITTGSKNTILGSYNGNQDGLDIRTSSNNIVLSDGDGNPQLNCFSDGRWYFGLSTSNNGHINLVGAVGASSKAVEFAHTLGGGSVGSITTGASSTAYNTSSDYRLKENIVDLTGATDRVQQLNPVRFNFIADADKTVDGFLAHEVADIVPEAISGEKDEVDADGNAVYQGIDQSKLVPLLTAALQEALTKIDDLEARIAALESN